MSDMMLVGCLRAPINPSSHIDVMQLKGRAIQAADKIEEQAAEIERLYNVINRDDKDDVNVFYSYYVYKNGSKSSYGSGSKKDSKERVFNSVMESIMRNHDCKFEDVHLVAFNRL